MAEPAARKAPQLVTIAFTKEQLWTLLNTFAAGYKESGENQLEVLISDKLLRAYQKFNTKGGQDG